MRKKIWQPSPEQMKDTALDSIALKLGRPIPTVVREALHRLTTFEVVALFGYVSDVVAQPAVGHWSAQPATGPRSTQPAVGSPFRVEVKKFRQESPFQAEVDKKLRRYVSDAADELRSPFQTEVEKKLRQKSRKR